MNKYYFLLSIILVSVLIRYYHSRTRTYFNNCDELICVATSAGLTYNNIPNNKQFNTKTLLGRDFKTRLKNCAFGGYGGDNGNCYFFNFVLSYWVDVFGLSDFSFRAFSILCDILSIVLLFFIGHKLNLSTFSIILSCLLFAISPLFVAFSGGFIRTYCFTAMLGLFSFLFYLKAYGEQKKTGIYFLFFISLILTFFTHFLSYYLFIAFLFFAFIKRKETPVFFKRISLGIIFSGILCLGILSLNKDGLADMKKRNENLKEIAAKTNITNSAESISFNTKSVTLSSIQYLLSYYTGSFSLTSFANALGIKIIPFYFFILFLLFPILLFILQFKEIIASGNTALLWIMVLSGNVSALLIMFASKHFTSLDIRYTLFTIPFFFLLITQLKTKKPLQLITLISFLIITCINLVGTINRNIKREIPIEIADSKEKFTIENWNKIKQYFELKCKDIEESEVLQFNNPNDYLFFVLLNEGRVKNDCIVSNTFNKGLTTDKNKVVNFYFLGP